jgi:hypothetical protein
MAGIEELTSPPNAFIEMTEPAPYKHTRVFLACLNCRRRKIKARTNSLYSLHRN